MGIHKSVCVVLLALYVSACVGGLDADAGLTDSVPEAERYGGTAVVAVAANIAGLNPLTDVAQIAMEINHELLFLPVVRLNELLEPQPALAESWTVRELENDSLELTFRLRDDVYWHDGVKTTAHDLEFAFRATRAKNLEPIVHYARETVVVDSFTLRLTLEPHVDYLHIWDVMYAMPRHLLAEVPMAHMATHPYTTERPVGNGPFKVTARDPGQSWTFAANDRFPAALGGRPYLDRIVIRTVPDAAVAATQLITGDLDLVYSIPAKHAGMLRDADRARVVPVPTRGIGFIAWNTRRTPFDDVRVRRALAAAIDKQNLIDGLAFGYGQAANSPVPPFHWAHDSNVGRDLAYDPERSRAMLREAGWEDRNGDGYVQDSRGAPLRFRMLTDHTSADWAHVIQANLREVGVEMRTEVLEFNSVLARVSPPARAFDALIMVVTPPVRVDDRPMYHCSNRDQLSHLSGLCEPEIDRLLDLMPTIPDRQEARRVWIAYQQNVARMQPHTFLVYVEALLGVGHRLVDVRPDVRGRFVGADRWWIRPDVR
jgi:peptide/nickel transport system substrate-binding protein